MDSDLVLKTRGKHGDASRAAQRYCGCGGMVDRVCGRCRTVGICRFVDLVIQRIGIWHIGKPCGMALCCAQESLPTSEFEVTRLCQPNHYATLARNSSGPSTLIFPLQSAEEPESP